MRLIFYKTQNIIDNKPPISVIICAKNEENNLKKHLPSVLTQDYPEYEVIVVNDCSEDYTELVLDNFKKEYPHLKTTKIFQDNNFKHGKKLAVTIGVKSAKNEWLVFTDADCQVQSKNWLTELSQHMQNETSVVIGYGGFFKEKGFTNLLSRTDNFFNSIHFLGMAIARKPYMGTGRNMAYKKTLHLKNKGFAKHYHLLSGDDDLFVNEVANKFNTKVVISPDSQTKSSTKKNLNQWFIQKRRHLTTSPNYRFLTKIYLGTEALSRFLFYASFISLLAIGVFPILVLSFFGFRMVNQLFIFIFTSRKLNEKGLWLFSLLYDVAQLFINAYIMLYNKLKPKQFKWK